MNIGDPVRYIDVSRKMREVVGGAPGCKGVVRDITPGVIWVQFAHKHMTLTPVMEVDLEMVYDPS